MPTFFLLFGLALAQAPGATPTPGVPTPGTATPGTATPGAAPGDAADDASLRRALELPMAARSLRAKGVPEADVRASLGAMKDAGVPASDAAEVTESA
ncbi:MAG: hypothetical protein ACK4YP_24855, partial [Myxococcota bacterium]